MARTRTVAWQYECDAALPGSPTSSCDTIRTIRAGDPCSTGRGTTVHDQADADAAARSEGWSVGRHVMCPTHTGGDV